MDIMGGDSVDSDTTRYGSSLGEIDIDGLLQTLSHPVRRDVIRYFENRQNGTTASLEELVAHLESQESTKTSDELWRTLYQVHLPTLQSGGWLTFDTERESVSYHGHEEAEQLLGQLHAIFTE